VEYGDIPVRELAKFKSKIGAEGYVSPVLP
jgi:hypothetical protein